MTYDKKFKKWLNEPTLPKYLQNELLSMDEKTKEDAFYTNLEFGTAGMRGLIGAGTNRINIFVVRQATNGLAQLIEEKGLEAKNRGVAIAYDSRHFSYEFAKDAASVLAYHGIKSYLFESLRPTPELSFAVRHLNAVAGIMITASHNPAPFNGYKVYGEDGGQMPPADADSLTNYIRAIDNPFKIAIADFEAQKTNGLIQIIAEDIDSEYLKKVKTVTINQQLIDKYGKDMKIVYTPLHGTGEMLARRALAQAGFESVAIVESQATADPEFSTVKSPNPESQAAFAHAEKLGDEIGADVLIATDPDADRLGVEIRLPDGSYQNLSGNQIGALMAKYILEAHKQAGTLPDNAALAKSIVSTELVTKIAESYNATMFNVLTGFKFIAEKIQEFEDFGKYTYMFGFEESFGYLVKPFVRDKDAIQAVLLIAEIAAYYRSRGLTLADGIAEIYQEYGYFSEKTISIELSGVDGANQIKAIMNKFRENTPTTFNQIAILKIEDFKKQTATDSDGNVTSLLTPQSDVLKYTLADDSWFAIRPSGTEPKIKLYISTVGNTLEDTKAKIDAIEAEIKSFIS
ncbi:phospho-sugar mutase [Streptococcus marimammalium]|uniref:phospho-sugar mutase n=1 Tax=Streptococcus marimammalium TaxID=269666 RepID=UPI000364D73F|nr:phospho-sugar mutase [Streptococcus marimammalium]